MTGPIDSSGVRAHFAEHAAHSDRSPCWCTDDGLAAAVARYTAAGLPPTVPGLVFDADVDAGSDKKAISEDRRGGIRRVHAAHLPGGIAGGGAEVHGVPSGGRRLFGIVVGEKV